MGEGVKLYRAMRAALACLPLCGCAAAPVADAPRARAETAVFVVPQGGHTGLAVRAADIPALLVPEKRDFPRAEWLEFGWGDRDFYMAPSPGPWLSFKAAFLPTPGVVHVAGVQGELRVYFPGAEIIEIPLSRSALEGLLRYVHRAFERNGGPAAPLGRGFYPGRDTFHLLRTCNVWTAGALRAAGLPVRDALTVQGILAQVRPLSAAAVSGR
jgi:uncharacterized protein (TIGR02117 family)